MPEAVRRTPARRTDTSRQKPNMARPGREDVPKGSIMKNKSVSLAIVISAVAVTMWCVASAKAEVRELGNPLPQPIIYVTSQGLYYDSIVTADPLPPRGDFQVLFIGSNGLSTEFGPGDDAYLGGRWVEDIDGDGILHFFSCPLLGVGRENP